MTPSLLQVQPYSVRIQPVFSAWRDAARQLLADGVEPDAILFVDESEAANVLPGFAAPYPKNPELAVAKPSVSKGFLQLAEIVACHRSIERWQLLYRVLWRLQSVRTLLKDELDEEVAHLLRLERQVRRDLHKMHAFLRFRVMEEQGQEHYIAWYRPDHLILPLAAPFFMTRFRVMRWSILTADASMMWNPDTQKLTWGPGVPREAAPSDDEMESMWKAYYSSIFNPARLNPRAMRAEMPVRYWRDLPEMQVLPTLMAEAPARVETMLAMQKQITANTFVPKEHALPVLQQALPGCQGCELYRCATQAVFGEGNAHAKLMLVGEQPGDEEDRAGRPFVGPAGRVLNGVLEELALDRKDFYITNAVKHFKFTERGKRRIHASPSLSEANACRPWLLAEIDAVRPSLVVALGAIAAKSLLGAKVALMKERGRIVESPYASRVIATIHPSAVLRAPDELRQQLLGFLTDDLATAVEALKA